MAKDLFKDLDSDIEDRYNERTKKVLSEEALKRKINEANIRIEKFVNQEKTLSWAKRALEFCDHETEEAKDIDGLSEILNKVAIIREDAKLILQVEADRIEKEKKEKEAKILKEAEEEKEYIKELENKINNLSKAERNEEWVKEVSDISLVLQGLNEEDLNKVKNRLFIDKYMREISDVEKAISIDEEINNLVKTTNKNQKWAKKVLALEDNFSGPHEKYLKNKDAYYKVLHDAGKALYSFSFASINDYLVNFEENGIEAVESEFYNIYSMVNKLTKEINLSDYIDNFDERWLNLNKVHNEYVIKQEELEEAKKEAKRIEEERIKEEKRLEQLRIAEEKRLEQLRIEEEQRQLALEKSKKDKKLYLIKSIVTLVILAVVITVGLITKDIARVLILGVGCSLVYAYAWFEISKVLLIKEKKVIPIIINVILVIFAIVSLFIEKTHILPLCVGSLVLVTILIDLINLYLTKNDLRYSSCSHYQVIVLMKFLLGIIVLGYSFELLLGGFFGALIAIVLIVGAVIGSYLLIELNNFNSAGKVIIWLYFLLIIVSNVLAYFGWSLFAIGGLTVLATCIISGISSDSTKFNTNGNFAGVIAVLSFISLFVAMMIKIY